MTKNIVICSDGTGNTASKGRGTNVFKLYEAVDLHQQQQVAIYDDGVGTQKWKPLKLVSGATGLGLSRNVKELYANLSRVYDYGSDSDDRIFLFGFSRGAFTVRTLADFICSRGLLNPEKCDNDADFLKQVRKAYSNYRNKYWSLFGELFKGLKWLFDNKYWSLFGELKEEAFQEVESIRFIGVWDTVDAVGLPSDAATTILNLFYKFKFNDAKLNKKVLKACHALAIDDERGTFSPVMWDEKNQGGRIEQVWFSGAHSNVGGGYPKQGMSLVSLDWMMARAEATGLTFWDSNGNLYKDHRPGLKFLDHDRELYNTHRNVHDKLYDSRSGFAIYYRYWPRNIKEIAKKNNITVPKVHISTVARIAQGTEGYSPGNLPGALKIVSTDTPPASYEEIEKEILKAHSERESLLKRNKGWFWLRVAAYFGFVVFSLSALALYFLTETKLLNPSTLDDLKKLGEILWGQPLILSGLILFIAINLWARGRMHKIFSKFWYHLQPKLKELLKDLGNPR